MCKIVSTVDLSDPLGLGSGLIFPDVIGLERFKVQVQKKKWVWVQMDHP